jgi:hypothetical protein
LTTTVTEAAGPTAVPPWANAITNPANDDNADRAVLLLGTCRTTALRARG